MAAELPEEVAAQVEGFEKALNELEKRLTPILALPSRAVQTQLKPLERAELHVLLAQAANSLFSMYLKTQGMKVEDHPVKKEVERVQTYLTKVDRMVHGQDLPGSGINVAAVNRFITHAVPDLTTDQKKALRAINKRERGGTAEESAPQKGKGKKMNAKELAADFLEGLGGGSGDAAEDLVTPKRPKRESAEEPAAAKSTEKKKKKKK